MNVPTRRLGRGLGSLIAGGGPVPVDVEVEEPVSLTNQAIESPSIPPVNEKKEREQNEHSVTASSSSQLQELMIEQVVPNPHQPRKVIDPQAISELAASIDSEGLLQPIVVRPVDNGYELIAGERRWRAHQHLGRKHILARILDATDLSSASLSLIENLQREELNPIEEALGYQSLTSDFNLGQEEVAKRMGKSRSHVANLMRLLQLDGELKRLLSDGELSVGHAKVLLGIDDPADRLSLARQAVLEGWTVRQTEQFLAKGNTRSGVPLSRKGASSLMYDDLAKSVTKLTGRQIKIKASAKGKGTVTLSFDDEFDLRKLLTKIES
jgi:ParB family chromosome partitioning protein